MTQAPTPLQPTFERPPGQYLPKENAPGAVTSLVCGIIGVAVPCTGLILGIIALMYQKKAKALIAQHPDRYGGGGLCTAGLVLGIIGVILGVFMILYLVFVIIMIGTFISHVPSQPPPPPLYPQW